MPAANPADRPPLIRTCVALLAIAALTGALPGCSSTSNGAGDNAPANDAADGDAGGNGGTNVSGERPAWFNPVPSEPGTWIFGVAIEGYASAARLDSVRRAAELHAINHALARAERLAATAIDAWLRQAATDVDMWDPQRWLPPGMSEDDLPPATPGEQEAHGGVSASAAGVADEVGDKLAGDSVGVVRRENMDPVGDDPRARMYVLARIGTDTVVANIVSVLEQRGLPADAARIGELLADAQRDAHGTIPVDMGNATGGPYYEVPSDDDGNDGAASDDNGDSRPDIPYTPELRMLIAKATYFTRRERFAFGSIFDRTVEAMVGAHRRIVTRVTTGAELPYNDVAAAVAAGREAGANVVMLPRVAQVDMTRDEAGRYLTARVAITIRIVHVSAEAVVSDSREHQLAAMASGNMSEMSVNESWRATVRMLAEATDTAIANAIRKINPMYVPG